jgi:hypothetical protein
MLALRIFSAQFIILWECREYRIRSLPPEPSKLFRAGLSLRCAQGAEFRFSRGILSCDYLIHSGLEPQKMVTCSGLSALP